MAYYFVTRVVVRFVQRVGRARLTRYSLGLDAFKQNYVTSEGLAVVDAEEREALRQASRCTQCGLCDQHLDAETTLDQVYRGAKASHVPLWLGPQPGRYAALAPLVRALRAHDPAALTEVCPERISFEDLMKLVERRS